MEKRENTEKLFIYTNIQTITRIHCHQGKESCKDTHRRKLKLKNIRESVTQIVLVNSKHQFLKEPK